MSAKITTGKITDQDLSWEDLKLILDNSFDEIFVIDPNGNTIYVNEACQRHYGAEPAELIGKPVQYVEEQGYCIPVLAPVFLKKKQRITLEQYTVFGKTLTVTSTPVFKKNGELRFLVLNSRDITDINCLRNDLEISKKMVEQYRNETKELKKTELEFAGIIAESPNMLNCLSLARRMGSVDANILILGESGVGKNVIANYIHKVSTRRKGLMMHINCASIPENLLESELFGYCKGAFSGAVGNGKKGLVELAHKGTLFLDEIGELPLGLQAKILQLVQERSFIPIGGTEKVYVDTRIIAATNVDLEQAVEKGDFRKDLFYRLNVVEINIPPLRQRREDIPLLINYFLNELNTKYKSYINVTPETMKIMEHYDWPGNVRELQHTLEQLVLLADKPEITPADLPTKIADCPGSATVDYIEPVNSHSAISYKELEIERVLDLYVKLRSSYKVAEELHISQSKATRIINKYYKNKTEAMPGLEEGPGQIKSK